MKNIFKLMCIFALTAFLVSCASAATPVATATPDPISTTIPETYNVVVTKWAAYDFGPGSFTLEMSVVTNTDGTGEYTSRESARDAISETLTPVLDVCNYDYASGSEESAYLSGVQITDACWKSLEEASGKTPRSTIDPELISVLSALENTSTLTEGEYVYIQSGVIIGYSDVKYGIDEMCGAQSLRYAGWDTSTGLYILNHANDAIADAMYENALGWQMLGSEIPDFCLRDKMEELEKLPNWLQQGHKNDMYVYTYDSFRVEVHTDPLSCDQHDWQGGRYYVTVQSPNGSNNFLIHDGDLLKMVHYDETNETHEAVYVTFFNQEPYLLTHDDSYYHNAAIEATTYCDGPSECLFIAEEQWPALPYMLNDVVVEQHLPEKVIE